MSRAVEKKAIKRQFDRVAIDTDVELSFDDFQSFKIQYAENISVGGMYLRTSELVPANSTLRFRLRIKDIDKEIVGKAIVVWTKEFIGAEGQRGAGMGLKFFELEGESERFIRDFVAKHVDSYKI